MIDKLFFSNIPTMPHLLPERVFRLFLSSFWRVFVHEGKKYPINRLPPISPHKSLTWKWNYSDLRGDRSRNTNSETLETHSSSPPSSSSSSISQTGTSTIGTTSEWTIRNATRNWQNVKGEKKNLCAKAGVCNYHTHSNCFHSVDMSADKSLSTQWSIKGYRNRLLTPLMTNLGSFVGHSALISLPKSNTVFFFPYMDRK